MPSCVRDAAASGVASIRSDTLEPSSTIAGYPRTIPPATRVSTTSGSSPKSQSVRPARSVNPLFSAPEAFTVPAEGRGAPGRASGPRSERATDVRARSASVRCRVCRSRSVPTCLPRSSTARNEIRRWPGTRSSSKSAAVTGWFATRCMRAASASSRAIGGVPACDSGPLPLSSAEKVAAQSAAGTTWRRMDFGRARSSAVISSSRIPGTCQSKPSGRSCASSASGTTAVTPSSAAPGSNR